MATPLLGWIEPHNRTAVQNAAHAAAELRMAAFNLLPPTLPAGTTVRLFDAWKEPRVVKDVGYIFPRFHQLTGSCVGAGGGQALFTLIAVQRLLATNPTTAFLPFWPFNYGRCRTLEGDRGQGEGAMGSSFADQCVSEGVIAAEGPNADPNLPKFQNNDGLILTEQLEMQWSDGATSLVTSHIDSARKHPLGTAAPLRTSQDIKAALLNGYPCTFACNNYIGHASVQGSGADAAVCGRWDGRGGHQQSAHGFWENASLGSLYWVQNNWPSGTYPDDPAGGPPGGCWVKEADVDAAFRLSAEVYAFSSLAWFPAQPDVLDKFAFLMI